MSDTNVRKEDTQKLSNAFMALHNELVDDSDKELLMVAFNLSNEIINKYALQAVASQTESRLLNAKQVQMKLAMSDVSRAVKKFKEVSG